MACSCGNESAIFKELDQFIEENNCADESSLIKVLHRAQHLFGYLPRNVQIHVAEKLNVSVAKVYGVISFYSYFTDTPRGENVIQVCIGTGCFVKGADKVVESFEKELNIKSGETTEDMKFTLSGVRCVGACGLAPVVIINEKVFGHVQSQDVKQILEDYLVESAVAS
ncbi:NADH-quinone oxidoreductase subunit E [Bacilli bacterium PM5-3]|nr:NADH-quinone oxidoreductase subunit E [Bacilli bacterium PM5-3]MDH6604245.1 NADH-quinone oxidoreductase subunit E [Bacilli bacterium PM5-9]